MAWELMVAMEERKGEEWIRERIHGTMVCESRPDDNQTSMHERYSPTHPFRETFIFN